MRANHLVALARGLFDLLPLQHPNSATPLLHSVQRIARRALHDLQEVGLGVERQDVAALNLRLSCPRRDDQNVRYTTFARQTVATPSG